SRSAGQRAFAPGDGLRLDLRPPGSRQRLVEGLDSPEQRPKLEAAKDLLQLRAVGRTRDEAVGIDIELEVAAHRREDLGSAGLVGVLGDRARSRGRELA